MKKTLRFDHRLHLSNQLYAYAETLSSSPSELLKELERETHLKTLAPQMLSGTLQGQILRMVSLIQNPRRILEIGTFTGYATLCLADGLHQDGELHTIEVNEELEWLIQKYIRQSEWRSSINLHIGDAAEIIPTLDGPFDLIFLDAGKHDYITHYELAMKKAAPKALILADNVLWSGKVLNENPDADTRMVLEFNAHLRQDPRVDTVLLPIRDGIMMARVRPQN